MPINCDFNIKRASQDEFHRLDSVVMRMAFDIHNSFGRFCDERIYQDELAMRCRMAGLATEREVEIRMTHGSFFKSYFIDMIVENSSIYELKAADSLAPEHQNQLINYLFLTEPRHGKLLNLRPKSVQSRYVSTSMNRSDRRLCRFNCDCDEQKDEVGHVLKNILISILDDWGTCLDLNAYREALLHHTIGTNSGLLPVPIISHGRIVGSQKMCLLNSETAWHLSTIKSNLVSHENHIRRLLHHTRLKRLYWINLQQNDVIFKNIRNDSVNK
jgi:GxxExxY protein